MYIHPAHDEIVCRVFFKALQLFLNNKVKVVYNWEHCQSLGKIIFRCLWPIYTVKYKIVFVINYMAYFSYS